MNNAIQDKNDWLMSQPKLSSAGVFTRFLTEATEDISDEFLSGHFQLAAEMIRQLYNCKDTAKTNNEETFAFDFLKCLVESKGLNRFWRAYNFEMDGFSVIPLPDEFYSLCSTFQNFLQNTSLCIPTDFVAELDQTGIYYSKLPINVQKFRTSSYTACLERSGALPYAETKEIFDSLYKYFRSQAPNLTIIWDQAYLNNIDGFTWCASDFDPLYDPMNHVAVPVDVIKEVSGNPLMLVSLPGPEPNLHAVPVTDELKYETHVFCRFSINIVAFCRSNPGLKRWEY
ncbi:uncharacterized protein LOC135937744 [Cloeon dipterum]|uniref:uncharacterized protein LOC135937744 n=1 Tax=Cloeon dipterum TaxID=197152 RepID=UPI00321F9B7E